MLIVKYETTAEKEALITKYEGKGYKLVEVANVKEGLFLGFTNINQVEEVLTTYNSLSKLSELEQVSQAHEIEISNIEKGIGAGGKVSENGFAKRLDDLEARIAALESG